MTKPSGICGLGARWWLFAAGVTLVVPVGAGGAQAAGGVLDPSFGKGGKVVTATRSSDGANAVAIQVDGKVVVAGSSATGSFSGGWRSDHFVLVRYTPSGRLDASFGRDGKVVTDFGGNNDQASSVAIQQDGKIVVAGSSDVGSSEDFALGRYTTDGKPDASFGNSGKMLTDLLATSDDSAAGIAIQKDGKIIVAGSTRDDGSAPNVAVARYTR